MSIRDLRQKFFAAHVCGCCNAPWPLLSSIIEHIGRLEKNTVDSVTVADTKTVAPGQPAYVVNQGTPKNVKLEFGIPEGIPGVNSVEVGETLTLEPGSDAYVRNVGDYDHLNLEFGIPAGAKGDKGDKGEQGTPGLPAFGYYGFARNNSQNPATTSIVHTYDFKSVDIVCPQVNNVTKNTHYLSDSCSLYRIGDWWYATFGGSYYKSQDMLNWYLGANSFVNPYGFDCAAGTISKLQDGTYVFITSVQYSDEQTVGARYNESSYYLIGYEPITQDENGELVFGEMETMNVASFDDKSTTYIDPSLVWSEQFGSYFFACKNEYSKTIEVYSGTTLENLALISQSEHLLLEAPCLIDTGTDIVLKAETFTLNTSSFHDFFGLANFNRQLEMFARVTYGGSKVGNVQYYEMAQMLFDPRHMTLTPCDVETAGKIADTFGVVHPQMGNYGTTSVYGTSTLSFYPKADSDLSRVLVNYPYTYYQFTSTAPSGIITVDIGAYFVPDRPIYLFNNRNFTHTIQLGSTFKAAGKQITMEPGSMVQFVFQGRSNADFALGYNATVIN